MNIKRFPYTSASLPQSNYKVSEPQLADSLAVSAYEEASKGQRVGGDDPLLAAVWYAEIFTDGREDDDSGLYSERLYNS